MSKLTCGIIFSISMLLLMASPASFAQPAATDSGTPATQPDKPPLKPEELQQILAPIALYPDSLVTQMLMASTYPLEIVQADRWVKANKDLKGDALATELEKQSWDPSVKSLVNFPDQLATMSEKLEVTIKIGDAFIGQQGDVMNTIQTLRSKAQANGNLKSNEQMKVDVQKAPPASAPVDATANNSTVVNVQAAAPTVPPPPQIITIESSSPQVVYVPTYNPSVVYGTWPYPSYPPYPYYPPRPPGYVATAAISFGVGVACGAAWGYAWGHSNWGGNNVDIDVNRNTNFNGNINRNNYQNNANRNNGNRTANGRGGASTWQHNPAHRDGVAYRNQASAEKFGGQNASRQATQAREQYRGRADAGRQDLNRGGADQFKGAQGNQGNLKSFNDSNRAGAGGGGTRDNAANRAGANGGGLNRDNAGANRPGANGGGTRDNAAANRPSAGSGNGPARNNSPNRASSSGTSSGAFSGVDRGGSGARADSQRGAASRSGGGASRGGGGGASRSGGGGARGGGGGRGGGGRR